MNWQAICDNPLFRDMPFKFETNRWGKIVMSPASNRHSLCRGLIARVLGPLSADGEVILGCSIQTADGVKVADVAWASVEFLRRHGVANPYPEAPEIVVEILSPSNTLAEMEKKRNSISPVGRGSSGFARKTAGCGFTTTMLNLRPARWHRVFRGGSSCRSPESSKPRRTSFFSRTLRNPPCPNLA